MITDEEFFKLVTLYIKPLFGIHNVSSCFESCNQYASQTRNGSVKLSLTRAFAKLSLKRNQAFSRDEIFLLRRIIANWAITFRNDYPKRHRDNIALFELQEAISYHVSRFSKGVVQKTIDLFDNWARETYEGQRISFSIGVDEYKKNSQQEDSKNFFSICGDDYAKVITSGHDTIITLDSEGNVISHESLSFPETEDAQTMLAPLSFLPIANWTSQRKYSICLNRIGEILIFKNKKLLFAKRRGKWKFFTHDAYIRSMHIPSENPRIGLKLRTALYITMLDTSFQRKGAGVGFIAKKHALTDDGRIKQDFSIIQQDDLLNSTNNKSIFISCLIQNKSFHLLSRSLRQELLSIDGATVILDNGKILSTGAILQIPGGSSGGGRKAAAHVLARYGLGVKVSNDGKIAFWKNLTDTALATEPPIYEIG